MPSHNAGIYSSYFDLCKLFAYKLRLIRSNENCYRAFKTPFLSYHLQRLATKEIWARKKIHLKLLSSALRFKNQKFVELNEPLKLALTGFSYVMWPQLCNVVQFQLFSCWMKSSGEAIKTKALCQYLIIHSDLV